MSLVVYKLLKNKQKKFIGYILLTIFFACIYCFFHNDEFGGINEIQLLIDKNKKDKTSKLLAKQEKKTVNNILERFFIRLYYSFTVVATVGFGDIYPASLRLKAVTVIQFMFIIYYLI